MKYKITHRTWYAYTELVAICHNLVHLAPRTAPHQECIDYHLTIDPVPAFITYRDDYFGNRAEYFSIEGGHQKLEIVAESTVEVAPTKTHEKSDSLPWEACTPKQMAADPRDLRPKASHPVLSQLSFSSPRVPNMAELREYAATSFPAKRPVIEALADLTTRIHSDFKFDSRATTVDTPLADVLRLRRGVCQDFAHLATGCLRAMGLPA